MSLMPISLDDKYEVETGRVFLTGIQALVRLPLMQHELDRRAGLNTAGFISGYRGSPLGGFDQQLWRAQKYLDRHNIVFRPGLNEDLAATAVWGSQQANLYPGAKFDGVFAMWYGKAPGVDRSGDAFKHANSAGTWPKGGVLAIAGDDHACKSSTLPSQSEYAFVDAEIPVLNPSGIQDVLDFGLYGWALSRFAGTWVGMIALAETMDASATVEVHPARLPVSPPSGFPAPEGGLGIRLGDTPQAQERRLRDHRIPAVIAFAHGNVLNRVVMDSQDPRIGILTAGKSYLDLRQALDDLGIGDREAAAMGLRVLKIGMTWPLEPTQIARFAYGLEELYVVEEKRDLIESQVKSILFNMNPAKRPQVYGKLGRDGKPLIRSVLDLEAGHVALALAKIIGEERWTPRIRSVVARLQAKHHAQEGMTALYERAPFYCSGCPHNTSTQVPEGSLGLAGIGCHYMVTWQKDRHTDLFTQMGAEGTPWIGASPFTTREHMFVNMGDGTYFHSGILALRAAVSAGVNATYKLLFNDAVAMTGGQHVDGELTVQEMVAQVAAEGVKKIVVMSDEPEKYGTSGFGTNASVEHRRELDRVQRELRKEKGVTVLIYDQTCAAEKRRRRKRGLMEDPPKRAFINALVCEGCGDCSRTSNCISVEPLETEFGRKRRINQSSCNKDFSCVEGFCPSFVTVHGGKLRSRAAGGASEEFELPEPRIPEVDRAPFNIVIGGIGGTGVTSIGAILGTAAHMERKSAMTLDMMGLAQKGGSVLSFVRIAAENARINGPRVPSAQADLLLGCDIVVAAKPDVFGYIAEDRTVSVLNEGISPTAAFVTDNTVSYDKAAMRARVSRASLRVESIDAEELSMRLLGDTIFANMFLTGYAYQLGEIPIGEEAISKAIELNGAAVAQNRRALRLGRLAVVDRDKLMAMAGLAEAKHEVSHTIEEVVDIRSQFLAGYQNEKYSRRYRTALQQVLDAERATAKGKSRLSIAAARSLFKLMAYKDEYEVARLYTNGEFQRALKEEFEGNYSLEFHLAPPIFGAKRADAERPTKLAFGGWMMSFFRLLATLRFLRGSVLDIFSYTHERKLERRLIGEFETMLATIASQLTAENYETAVALAEIPLAIKGYGYIKDANCASAKKKEAQLLAAFQSSKSVVERAALTVAAE
ncbi:MAG: indolepyruvate ferredoxin oxidoreductase family protein [Alphaproteobacteria bacterium]|nr:indolepyruvate ferredoxin oxidoreductase family protein [Alphaproteobacteria bacterium]